MKSHAYANKLKDLAEFLLSKPEFETSNGENYSYLSMYYFGDKDKFLGAVRAVGAGSKEYDLQDIVFHPAGAKGMLRIVANRSSVCRKVQEEKWECEPLLSVEEEAQVGA